MRSIFMAFFCFLSLITTIANANQSTKTEATRENLLEDAVIDLLQPQMYEAVKDYYGTTKEIGFMCLNVIDIKKLEHPGSWYFETILEGVTYTGPHTPMDIFTVTVEKMDATKGIWEMKDYKVGKFIPEEKHECRDPA
ncbi:DUF3888 domain-containing protein [Oceanobacillus profundus]|nr:DUF3888 domain-containing protein [Oceanobacillus profundus]